MSSKIKTLLKRHLLNNELGKSESQQKIFLQCTLHVYDKRLELRIYIQNYQSVMKPQKRFKTRQIFNINFTKVDILIVNNHMKKFKIIDQGSAN